MRAWLAAVLVLAGPWSLARAALPDFDEEDEAEEVDRPAPAAAARAAPQAAVEPAALRSDVASDAEAERERGLETSGVVLPERELNGHYFLPPLGLTTPFVSSHVGATTTFGVADLRFTDPAVREYLRQLEELLDADFGILPLFLLAQGLELQLGLFDRVALRAAATGTALLPRDEDTAWLMAADGGWGAGAGVSVQAWKTRYFAVAASFDAALNSHVTVSPLDTFAKLLVTGQLDRKTMFTMASTDEFSPGLQLAASPHPVVGFLAEGAVDFEHTSMPNTATEDPDDETETRDRFFRAGLGASFDASYWDVPVGVVGSWIGRFPLNEGNDTKRDDVASVGLYYTGRRYLLLGVEAQFLTLESETADEAGMGASLRIRAYF